MVFLVYIQRNSERTRGVFYNSYQVLLITGFFDNEHWKSWAVFEWGVFYSSNGFLSDGVTPALANFDVSNEDRFVLVDGEINDRLALNSQVRFQNYLDIDNLSAKHSGDYDGDGIHEVYWKTNNGTAFLRSLMHHDGNKYMQIIKEKVRWTNI